MGYAVGMSGERFIPVHTGNIVFIELFIFSTAVYPCAYREHLTVIGSKSLSPGLSLCIQGTFDGSDWSEKLTRFIPVHTGNMNGYNQKFGDIPVYPCAYREHLK